MKTIAILSFVLLTSCANRQAVENEGQDVVLTGLNGTAYKLPTFSVDQKATLDKNLQLALANFQADPSEENYIWYGRREAYLYNYKSAIEIFNVGIEKFPDSYRLYRHRGHRYITLRQFDKAIEDLKKAAELMQQAPLEIEPDGQPNKLNTPLSSTQFNVWYHLGLAHYLKGEFALAEQAYLKCMEVSDNDDLITATVDWLYMTYRREGKEKEATALLEKIHGNMRIIENDSYLVRLNLYKGIVPVDSVLAVRTDNEDMDLALATQGYGVGNWYLYNGDTAKATEVFKQVVSGKHFAAFGFIAAEAELARLKP
jgi:tetratricopeptide (TPR) repeat protein